MILKDPHGNFGNIDKLMTFDKFGIIPLICTMHVMIFINKYLLIFLRISFYELSKSTAIIILTISFRASNKMQYVMSNV